MRQNKLRCGKIVCGEDCSVFLHKFVNDARAAWSPAIGGIQGVLEEKPSHRKFFWCSIDWILVILPLAGSPPVAGSAPVAGLGWCLKLQAALALCNLTPNTLNLKLNAAASGQAAAGGRGL